jgi:hypothetical protein
MMATLHEFTDGGFRFLEGGFPYSQGVVALPGHAIERVRFERPVPVAAGFDAIAAHLASIGRPLTSLAACELRSPRPFTPDGFMQFNRTYRRVLEDWGLVRNDLNPVARSNLAPQFDAPAEPCFHAFSYTVLEAGAPGAGGPDFVVAGSGEWPENTPFPEGIVARGDVSPGGLARKVDHVLDTMQRRTEGLRVAWAGVTASQVYTVHDIHPLLGPAFAARGLLGKDLALYACRPPIIELEFEMDVRRVRTERVLAHAPA